MRELCSEDVLMYMDQIKMEFHNCPQIDTVFLKIMKFNPQEIDAPDIIRQVCPPF
jgi:histone deacetylase complex regulatory component SIN3